MKVTLGNAELWHGDCLELLPLLPTFSCIVSDPPYGIGFVHSGDGKRAVNPTKFANVSVIGDDAPFDPAFLTALGLPTVLWGANHYANRLDNSGAWLCWDKRAASGHSNDFSDCELAWTNKKNVARMFRHHWDGMMKASEQGEPRTHPTQKPVALMEWCIAHLGRPVVVFDPYMGTGATGVAAMNLGLKFIGVEIHLPYFDIACERIARAQAQSRLFATVFSPVAEQKILL